jgi:RNA polymerase sigma factor (sigma-70 family)
MVGGSLTGVLSYLRGRVNPLGAGAESDRELLARFSRGGDGDAFAEVVRRHAPMVLAVCRRVVGDVQEAEDAFQATFVVLARKAGTIFWHDSVGSWLHAVAYRVASRLKAQAARRGLRERQDCDMHNHQSPTCADHDELRAALDVELARLPEKYRAPLVLCYLEGKSNDEAARLLGWTKGTVSGRLARARDLLRARLVRRGLSLSALSLAAVVSEKAAPAAVPALLFDSTVRVSILSAGQNLAAGALAGPVANLAEGVLRTMLWEKIRLTLTVVVAVTVVAAGLVMVGFRSPVQADGADEEVAAAATPVAPDVEERPDPEAANAIKKLIPRASSISIADWRTLSAQAAPDPATMKNQALSLVLMSLDFKKMKAEGAARTFRFLQESVKPDQLAKAIARSEAKGYGTLLQPEFITEVTCRVKADTASGTVSFRNDKIYEGKIRYSARCEDGNWRVEEFRVPGYGLRVALQKDGTWKRETLTAAVELLDAARDLIQEKNWTEAVQVLQGLLSNGEDSFVEVTARDKNGRASVRFVSVHAEANRLLGSLPREGREVYELQYGAKAADRLAEARKKKDPELLGEVFQRYWHTRAGAEAAKLLADYYLKRDPTIAIGYLDWLKDRTGEQPAPAALFSAALAYRHLGDSDRARQIEHRLFGQLKVLAKFGKDELIVDGQKLTVEEARKQLEEARPQVAREWLMARADAQRTGFGHGKIPFLDEDTNKWTQAMIHQEQTKVWIDQAVKAQESRKLPVLPAFRPVTVRRRDPTTGKTFPTVVYRSYFGVHAADLKTGKLVWEQDLDYSVDKLNQFGRLAQLKQWVPTEPGDLRVLYENSTLASLSTDGSLVFVIDELALPPDPKLLALKPNFGVLVHAINGNRLTGISADPGKRIWQLGGGGENAGEFANSFFLGAPLPLHGKLYVLNEKDSELRLVCLNSTDGKRVWSQTLATMREPAARDVGRRIHALDLAYADGVLVCPTNAGTIFGFDLVTRRLLWVHRYEKSAPAAGNLTSDWRFSAPCIGGGKVVFTAPDGAALNCLNVRDGSLVWKVSRADDVYIATIFKGKVVVVGRGGCRALNLADGKQAWQVDTGMPSGIGAASDGAYLLPLSAAAATNEPEICVIDLDQGKIRSHVRGKKVQVGNLIFCEGRVISQTVREIVSYPELLRENR